MNILYIDTDLNFSITYVRNLIAEALSTITSSLKSTKIEFTKIHNLIENAIYVYRIPKANEILNLLDVELENLLNPDKNNGLKVISF